LLRHCFLPPFAYWFNIFSRFVPAGKSNGNITDQQGEYGGEPEVNFYYARRIPYSWDSRPRVEIISKISYKKKQWRPPRKKEERRKKPKPEEQEGMPQHQHCPPEKRRRDENPECHKE
jgi:hypothetical protein